MATNKSIEMKKVAAAQATATELAELRRLMTELLGRMTSLEAVVSKEKRNVSAK